ncbi:MAG TPA: DUF6702 family protein [Bacteroidales bacterium]|nr:DUF6702 family protein [Bacteroidales bacterium]
MNSFLSYIIAGWLSLFSFASHPLHVSLTSIEYSSNVAMLKVAVKVNTEDFELAMAHNYEIILNLNKKNELKDCNKYINNYFVKALQIILNDKDKLQLTLNRKQTEEESTWLYFDIPYNEQPQQITIKNALLLDTFMEQTNMVILSLNRKEKGFKLDFNNREIVHNILQLVEPAK